MNPTGQAPTKETASDQLAKQQQQSTDTIPSKRPYDLTRASSLDDDAILTINDMFDSRPLDRTELIHGETVRGALIAAVRVIIAHVPPSPDRWAAIRKLREAGADCNSAITHGGRY